MALHIHVHTASSPKKATKDVNFELRQAEMSLKDAEQSLKQFENQVEELNRADDFHGKASRLKTAKKMVDYFKNEVNKRRQSLKMLKEKSTKDSETKYILKQDATIDIPDWKGQKTVNGEAIVRNGTVFYKKGSGFVPWMRKDMKPITWLKESHFVVHNFDAGFTTYDPREAARLDGEIKELEAKIKATKSPFDKKDLEQMLVKVKRERTKYRA